MPPQTELGSGNRIAGRLPSPGRVPGAGQVMSGQRSTVTGKLVLTSDAISSASFRVAAAGYGRAPVGMDQAGGFDFTEIDEKILADAVSNAAGPASDVRVHSLIAEGIAAQVLLDAAAGADLLVLGSRGHGGFAKALLGSVSQHCVQHARCPVVVIATRTPGTSLNDPRGAVR
jgi:nucleotide-binding universal stress UspA family protein